MTIVRQTLSGWVPLLYILISLAALFEPRDSSILVVNAFASIVTSAKLAHSNFRSTSNDKQQTQTALSRTRLLAYDRQIEIRDWSLADNEPRKIYDFLLQWEQDERRRAWNFFDPEGSLELDVLNEFILEESYSKDSGGCFLVVTNVDYSENDNKANIGIVGTLGMIAGTQVSYQSSGSSVSKPQITAAIRRVCASWVDDDEDYATNKPLAWTASTTKILTELIHKGEERALQSGATDIIGLAYSELGAIDDNGDERKKIAKPTASLFESLGYRVSEQQIPGVATIQYEKKLSKNQPTTETSMELESPTRTIEGEKLIIPAAIATIIFLGFLIFNLYSNVFGIDQFWGSVDNGGLGTSLSTQNLEELIRDEKLGRSGIDDGVRSARPRQWEDLSPEELREEQALMKVIQGQSIRSK